MRPAIEESLDVLEVELKKLGKVLGTFVFGGEAAGKKKLNDSRGR